jgi:hypothetical protein
MSTPFSVGDGFPDTIVGGTALIIPAINSPNFLTGVTGWSINANGTAEFNNGIFRGNLTANSITAGSIGSSTITGSDFQQGTMEETNVTFDTAGGRLLIYGTTTVSSTFTTSGTFVVPAGITSLKVECIGGGSGGILVHTAFNEAGSGGEYACESNLAVTALGSYPYTVGSGAAGGNTSLAVAFTSAAGFSQFAGDAVTVYASGGYTYWDTSTGNTIPGQSSTNTIHFNGGTGGDNTSPQNNGHNQGSGGGGSAGSASGGNNGLPNNVPTSNTGGAGGPAVTGGGAGGRGGNGVNSGVAGNGVAGSAPGGGGGSGGFGTTDGASAAGANGQIKVTYVSGRALIGSIAGVGGTDQYSNTFPAGFMTNELQVTDTTAPSSTTGATQVYSATGRLSTVAPSGSAGATHTCPQTTVAPVSTPGSGLFSLATYTIPANDAQIGTIYKIHCWGLGSQTVAVQNVAWQCYLGATGLGQIIAAAAAQALGNWVWWVDATLQIITIGTSGTANSYIRGSQNQTTNNLVPGTAADNTIPFAQQGTTTPINTTVSNTFISKGGYSTNQVGTTFICDGSYVERIGP